MQRSQASAALSWSARKASGMIPALLTSTSIRPWSSTTRSTAARTGRPVGDVDGAAALGVDEVEPDHRRPTIGQHGGRQQAEPAGGAGDDDDLAFDV